MQSYGDFELYDFLRYSAVIFLVINSLQRLINPDSALFYMSEEFFWFVPVSRLAMVYFVMIFSLICAILILVEFKTFYASASMSLILMFVTSMLVVEAFLFAPESSKPVFLDIALRDFEVLVVFLSVSLMSWNRRKE